MKCLRCRERLRELDGAKDVRFFRCSACKRDYALRRGGNLVDRWLSPISLVLYPIIYSRHPQDDVDRVVEIFRTRFVAPPEHRDIMEDESEQEHRAKLANIVADIRAELSRPTQRVRDILKLNSSDEVVSEADIREFLSRVADGLDTPSLRSG